MSLYRAYIRIVGSRWAPSFSHALTADALARAVTNVLANQLTAMADQSYDAELLLQRPTHYDALLEISGAVERLGFVVGEAFIVEYASAVAESAVSGFFGGGALGTASRNPVITLVGASVGAAVGAFVGQFIQIERARYRANWDSYSNSWELTQVTPPNGRQVVFGYA